MAGEKAARWLFDRRFPLDQRVGGGRHGGGADAHPRRRAGDGRDPRRRAAAGRDRRAALPAGSAVMLWPHNLVGVVSRATPRISAHWRLDSLHYGRRPLQLRLARHGPRGSSCRAAAASGRARHRRPRDQPGRDDRLQRQPAVRHAPVRDLRRLSAGPAGAAERLLRQHPARRRHRRGRCRLLRLRGTAAGPAPRRRHRPRGAEGSCRCLCVNLSNA
ncbi:MAG: hypothetical protein MZW92_42300 [Comamonadaceae bacterium]|nr:hypothetical protein [Comamonadaceae bacterium]